MRKSTISRRQFVETTVLGAGCLTLAGFASSAVAARPADLATILPSLWKANKDMTLAFAQAMPEEH